MTAPAVPPCPDLLRPAPERAQPAVERVARVTREVRPDDVRVPKAVAGTVQGTRLGPMVCVGAPTAGRSCVAGSTKAPDQWSGALDS